MPLVTCGAGGSTNAEVVEQINNNTTENIFSIDSMVNLLLVDFTVHKTVNIRGYYNPNDGRGYILNYDSTIDRSTADGDTIVDPSQTLDNQGQGSGVGCWIRQGVNNRYGDTSQLILMSYQNTDYRFGRDWATAGRQGLRLAISKDGKYFETITTNVIDAIQSTTPSIIYHQDSWWCIGDDSTLGFTLYKSENLSDWEIVATDIQPSGLPATYYDIWDVDFFLDDDANEVYISMSINIANSTDPALSRFSPYMVKVLDLKNATLDTAFKISSTAFPSDKSFIDFTVKKNGNSYVGAIKTETGGERDLFILTASSLTGTWTKGTIVYADNDKPVEAPSLVKIDNTWYMYYDKLVYGSQASNTYMYITSLDLVTWSDENFIDSNVTMIRHGYHIDIKDKEARRGLSNNITISEIEKPTVKTKQLPRGTVFAIGAGLTDLIGGLEPNEYESSYTVGGGVFNSLNSEASGQILPAGFFSNSRDSIYLGKSSFNRTNSENYNILSSRFSAVEKVGYLDLTVNVASNELGIYWISSLAATNTIYFTFVSGTDLSADIQISDRTTLNNVTPESITVESNGSGFYHQVEFIAPSTGNYFLGISTNSMTVGDRLNIKNIMVEVTTVPSPYLIEGKARAKSSLTYVSDILNIKNKFIMTKLSTDTLTNNDYIYSTGFNGGVHKRVRLRGADNEYIKDAFIYAKYDEFGEIQFGGWFSKNISGTLEVHTAVDPDLPQVEGVIQLGDWDRKVTYEYFIVGYFIGSEFDLEKYDVAGQTNQREVQEYILGEIKLPPQVENKAIPNTYTKTGNNGETNNGLTGEQVAFIKDDSVASFIPISKAGFITITAGFDNDAPDMRISGIIAYDAGTSLFAEKSTAWATTSSLLDVVLTDVTGITGTDGRVTVAILNNEIKIENRFGGNINFKITYS